MQKLKRIILRKILLELTDSEHAITISEIIDELAKYDITAERKSLYKDIKVLEHTGIKIVRIRKGREWYYKVAEREFELPELKLLVDAIQSSKFITINESQRLIEKLEKFSSIYDAKKLDRQVYVQGRIKSINDSVYNVVDNIHTAISDNKTISFQYFNWNIKKKMEYKHEGYIYVASPWLLVWSDEYYYLVAYDHDAEIIKHFRVDKIININILSDKRKGKEQFKSNIPDYSKYHFGMYGGEKRTVRLKVKKELAGVIIDRFGKNITIEQCNDDEFITDIKVAVSNMFFGWIFGLGKNVEIMSPEDIREQAKKEIQELSNMYKKKSP